MTRKELTKLLDRYRVTDGKGFRLKHHDPDDTGGALVDKEQSETLLTAGVARLAELQPLLYAQDSWAMLCVFQAMDAAGKDGTIKHVMSGVNPQGVQVVSFKQPGPEELEHDYLWRVSLRLPARGNIGVFNRSHYEEVLVVRVHPELLDRQRLPTAVNGRKVFDHRLQDIAAFERYLHRQGTVVRKFFLHISRAEQKRRFLARLDTPDKNWKFSAGDIAERAYWDDYMSAYEEAIAATATPHAPWFVVPADHKWFSRMIVVEAMIEALESLELHAPVATDADRAKLAEARRKLEAEKD
ncbi:MAG: polyphosphate kinase 2 family protein [Alphaproteobacteria bacterium]|nr:polyphosphate kinase 2 family protein [Alphaproteobacteria bacterium]